MNQTRQTYTWRSILLALLTAMSLLIAPLAPLAPVPVAPAPTAAEDASPLSDLRPQTAVVAAPIFNLYNSLFATPPVAAQASVSTCTTGSPAFVHGLDDTGTSGIGLSVWLSNGDGTFNPNEISFAGFDRDGVGSEVFGDGNLDATYFADINNDGTLDIVHATETGGNAIYVYLNNGNNTFDTTAIATTGMQNVTDGTVFAGRSAAEQGWLRDANGDGNLDYLFSGDDNNIHVYLGNGDGTFVTNRITTALSGAGGRKTSGVSGSEGFLADDVNGDNSVDLIGTFDDSGTGRMQVWLGNGDGTFNPTLHFNALLQDSGATNTSGSANNEYSQFADVNGDGALDYLHTETADSAAQIWAFLNNGDGTFQTNAIVTTATAAPLGVLGIFSSFTSSEQSLFADVTEDGIVDYVTSYDDRGANSGISVYIGNGDGTFATTPTPTTIPNFGTGTGGGETTFIGCGFVAQAEICDNGIDDDLDGLVDSADPDCADYVPPTTFPMCSGALAFIHGADNNGTSGLGTSVWLANGNGTFSSQEISFSGFDREGVGTDVFGDDNLAATYFADVNKDGPIDIVHATETGGNAIYVYLNNGDNTFNTTSIASTGMQNVTDGTVFAGRSAAEQGWMGDADGDGNLDYLFSGSDSNIHVYRGNGDGTFVPNRITTALSGSGGRDTSGVSNSESFLVADVNGDGSIDLIGTFDDSGTGRMQVWLGNGDGTFNPTLHFDTLLQDSGGSNTSGSADNEHSQFADVNGDGALDYLHAESLDGTAQIWAFFNNGDGTFQTTATTTTITNYPAGLLNRFANFQNAEQSFFADANNDGIIDYVTSSDNLGLSSGISVYLGNGNGTFSNSQIMTPLPDFATGTDALQSTYLGCGFAAGTEICGNNIDEDFDGLIDQQDPDASCYIATSDTRLTKAFSPSTIAPNGVSTLIFTISENATDDGVLNTVNFVDTLPAGVTITNTAGIVNNCTGGMVTANAGSDTIRVQSAVLNDGAGSCTISVPVTASAQGAYTNGAGNMSGLVDTETSSMNDQTLTVSAGLTDVDGDGINDTEEGTGCVGAAGAHAPPVVVDTNVLSSTLGCIATDTDNDGTPDNIDQCPNTPTGGVVDTDGCPFDTDLSGAKSASVTSITPGIPFDYTLTVNNSGAETHNVKVIDVVEAGLTINGTSTATNNNSTGGACTVSGQVVTCTWDIMDDGASETITINVTP
ncbi:MAG: FG-GAP-like repeat-containing protein [Chloroflexota bacterium]